MMDLTNKIAHDHIFQNHYVRNQAAATCIDLSQLPLPCPPATWHFAMETMANSYMIYAPYLLRMMIVSRLCKLPKGIHPSKSQQISQAKRLKSINILIHPFSSPYPSTCHLPMFLTDPHPSPWVPPISLSSAIPRSGCPTVTSWSMNPIKYSYLLHEP